LSSYTRFGLFGIVIASVSQRSNLLKIKRLLRQKAPRNDCSFNPQRVYLSVAKGKWQAKEMDLPFALCHWQGGIGSSNRVLRGGAFNNNDRNVRCAARNRNNPNNRNDNIGFRVVLRTFFFPTGIAGRFIIWASQPR